MKTQPALIGPDRAVHLNAEPSIDLHFPLVVKPWHTEHQNSFGLRDTFQDLCFLILRVAVQHESQRIEHFEYSLVKFRLGRVLGLYEVKNLTNIVPRRMLLGRFHHCSHRLASEFFRTERICSWLIVDVQRRTALKLLP